MSAQPVRSTSGDVHDLSLWVPTGNKAETILVQCEGRVDQPADTQADWAVIAAASGEGLIKDLLCAHRARFLLLPPVLDFAAAGEEQAWFGEMNRIDGATEPAHDHPIHSVDHADIGTRPVTVMGMVNGAHLDVTGFLDRRMADSCLYLTLRSQEGERLWSGSVRQRHLAVAAYSTYVLRAGMDMSLLEDAVEAGLSPGDLEAMRETGDFEQGGMRVMAALRGYHGHQARWPYDETLVRADADSDGWLAIWGTSTGNQFDATAAARGYVF